jgi:outer membrane protein OmpA-like peptidoglycan-associated protein
MNHIIRTSMSALVVGLFAAGCAHGPSASDQAAAESAIGNAGQAIDRASGDPHVSKYASSELERANDSLTQAKTVWSDKHDLQMTRHLAYLAQQRAATAQELANGRAAEQTVAAEVGARDNAVQRVMQERQATEMASTTSTNTAPSGTASAQEDLTGFRFNAAKVPPKAKPMITELANAAKADPNSKVVIEGHTDNVGSPAYNQALALSRAQAVRSALVREGVDASRIEVRSLGEENPMASNDTKAGRSENRRAQVFIGEGGATAVGSSQGGSTGSSSGDEQKGQKTEQPSQPPSPPATDQPAGQSGQNGQDDQRKP